MNLNLPTKIHELVDAQLDEIATDKVLKVPFNYPIMRDSERRISVQRS